MKCICLFVFQLFFFSLMATGYIDIINIIQSDLFFQTAIQAGISYDHLLHAPDEHYIGIGNVNTAIFLANDDFVLGIDFPVDLYKINVTGPDLNLEGFNRSITYDAFQIQPTINLAWKNNLFFGLKTTSPPECDFYWRMNFIPIIHPILLFEHQNILNQHPLLFNTFYLNGNVGRTSFKAGLQLDFSSLTIELLAGSEHISPTRNTNTNTIQLFGLLESDISAICNISYKNEDLWSINVLAQLYSISGETASYLNSSRLSDSEHQRISFFNASISTEIINTTVDYYFTYIASFANQASILSAPISPVGNIVFENNYVEDLDMEILLHKAGFKYDFNLDNITLTPGLDLYYIDFQSEMTHILIEGTMLPFPVQTGSTTSQTKPLSGDILLSDVILKASWQLSNDIQIGAEFKQLIPIVNYLQFWNTDTSDSTSTSSTSSSSNISGGTRASLWIEYSFDAP